MTVYQHDFFNTELQGIVDAEGHRWFNKYSVLTKCGTLIDYSKRGKPYTPRLAENICQWCGSAFWRCKHHGRKASFCGTKCSSLYANGVRLVESYINNPMDRCFICHQWFRPRPSKEGGKTICCSSECGHQFRKWAEGLVFSWSKAEFSKVSFKDCIKCGKLFASANGGRKTCSDECSADIKRGHTRTSRKKRRASGFDNRGRHRKRCRHYNKEYDPKVNLSALVEYYAGKCATCDCTVKRSADYHPRQASIGHIVALSDTSEMGMKHGHHIWSNVMLQCVTCNSYQQTNAKGRASLLAMMV